MTATGTMLTTRQTLLNPNRNGWTKDGGGGGAPTKPLARRRSSGSTRGCTNDHTDGHIDNLARFVAPGRVVCQTPGGDDDPNADVLNAIAHTLESATRCAAAAGSKSSASPGVGSTATRSARSSPASHMNFIIANGVVVVPVYGTRNARLRPSACSAGGVSRTAG